MSQTWNALQEVPVIVTVAQWMTDDRSRKLYAKVWIIRRRRKRRRVEYEHITINCTTKHKRITEKKVRFFLVLLGN